MNSEVNLKSFNGSDFDKGAGLVKITLWYFVNALLVRPVFIPFMDFRLFWLRFFGAKIGKRICLKPGVLIKSPWNFIIGDDCWIGENVWIDNLDKVTIGSNVCISQGAMLLTGNHDYKISSMPYKNGPIVLEDGVWIGAKTIVCPSVQVHSHSILTVGSIATNDMEAWGIYQGNPARKIRIRNIKK